MTKPFLTYKQQLNKLQQDKKLVISNPEYAYNTLKHIGYFALIGGYKNPFINPMTRIYENNTSFEDIHAFYMFDSKLRELIFHYLCQIEQYTRQLITYSFCSKHGEKQTAYLNTANYNQTSKNQKGLAHLINILSYHANKNTDHSYLVHQRRVYKNVPLWAVANTLTFGQISKLYSFLPHQLQTDISKEYPSVDEKKLAQYLKILTLFRNVCAHNERLFSFRTQIDFPDTDLHQKLNIPKQGKQYQQGKRDLFGVVIAFRYLLPRRDFLIFKKELIKLINDYLHGKNHISETSLLSLMGFPCNWKNITRYRL